jgi:hypothetical protein
MKFKGTIIGEASGSFASLTFSHNRGGQYVRQRAVPVNPGTVEQQANRNSIAELTSRWQEVLTQAQRDAWTTYSDNVPIRDSLGEPRAVGGLPMYCRSNVPRLQTGLPRVDDAPTIFDLGAFTTPSIDSVTPPTGLDIAFDNTDDWANEDDSAMIILASRPQSPAINFFKGPYRLSGFIAGNAITPPTSPATLVLPFPVATGTQLFIQGRVSRADGRLSSPFRLGSTV